MARLILLSAILMVLGVAGVAGQEPAHAQENVACESQEGMGDTRDFHCPLGASEIPRHFRFKANFSGGHDDTLASMAVTLDGAPLECGEGSKTSLRFEEGDVSLECRFSIGGLAGKERVLVIALRWHHAQYSDVELARFPEPQSLIGEGQ